MNILYPIECVVVPGIDMVQPFFRKCLSCINILCVRFEADEVAVSKLLIRVNLIVQNCCLIQMVRVTMFEADELIQFR